MLRYRTDVLFGQDSQPEESLFAYTRQHKIGVIARMVIGRFVFQREPHYEWERPMRDRALKMRRVEWFERHVSLSSPELLLRYVLSNPNLHCALVGTTNLKHLEVLLNGSVAGDRKETVAERLSVFKPARAQRLALEIIDLSFVLWIGHQSLM